MKGRRKVFIEEYLKCWNASEAARNAGYKSPGLAGHRLLKNDGILAQIQQRLDEMVLKSDETLRRLSQQATFDLLKYTEEKGNIDLMAIKADGLGHLVKGIRPTKFGDVIDFHDGQTALLNIAKYHGLLKERTEGEQRLIIEVEYVDNWREADTPQITEQASGPTGSPKLPGKVQVGKHGAKVEENEPSDDPGGE